MGDGLAPTTDFTDTMIDGAPATTGRTRDHRGERVTVTTIDPVVDGARVDENPLTEDIDFQVDDRVRTSVSDDTGLVVTERPGRFRDALADVIGPSGSGGDGASDGAARAAFLDSVAASGGATGVDVVEVAPRMPMASGGDSAAREGARRVHVDTGRPGTDDGDGGGGRMTVVDTRNLAPSADGEPQAVTIVGSGNVVVRGGGTFEGADELADDGVPDPDNVLGDDTD